MQSFNCVVILSENDFRETTLPFMLKLNFLIQLIFDIIPLDSNIYPLY